jgi:hypothetical protein
LVDYAGQDTLSGGFAGALAAGVVTTALLLDKYGCKNGVHMPIQHAVNVKKIV